jgi:hypothetical protein
MWQPIVCLESRIAPNTLTQLILNLVSDASKINLKIGHHDALHHHDDRG